MCLCVCVFYIYIYIYIYIYTFILVCFYEAESLWTSSEEFIVLLLVSSLDFSTDGFFV